jgi:NADPH2:quinone reductase
MVTKLGGPDVLAVEERPDPEPGPGQIVVDVRAAGVNFMDVYQREGVGPYKKELPFGIGDEGAGVVTAAGEGVDEFKPGDHVAWRGVSGSYAERVVVPVQNAVPVPEHIDFQVAAAVLLQGMTAHYLCNSTYPIKDGNVAVVHAAAGGVGLLLVQMIKRRGGIVVATTSTKEKADLVRQAGADHVVTYDEFVDAVDRVTGERGADVVYDSVGKATFDNSLKALRPRGMMVLYGGSSGQVPPFDIQRLNTGGSLYLTRPTLANYAADRSELLWRVGDLFEWIAQGTLDVRIGGTYPLSDAGRAQADLESRRTTGKLLLIPLSRPSAGTRSESVRLWPRAPLRFMYVNFDQISENFSPLFLLVPAARQRLGL